MILGREINLPADLAFKLIVEETFDCEKEHVTQLRETTITDESRNDEKRIQYQHETS